VRAKGDFIPFSRIVSGRSPFGLNTNHYGSQQKKNATDINYFERKGFSYMEKSKITKNRDAINKYKLFIAKTAEDGKLPGKVIGNITDGNPGTICSGTYLLVGPFETAEHMNNVKAYMQTKFFRALVSINKITQDAYSKVYEAVPIQDFRKTYNDLDLYKKYDLSDEEIEFIESMIRPMDLGGSDE
jgi:site-specific DNA-methyltransferase (adenine-specific)